MESNKNNNILPTEMTLPLNDFDFLIDILHNVFKIILYSYIVTVFSSIYVQ